MASLKEQNIKKEEDISLRDVFLKIGEWMHFLLHKWKWILLFGFIGLVGGITYALVKAPEYTASVTFVTDAGKNRGSALSSYVGLAAQFGFDANYLGMNNNLFSADNIFDLMQTRLMLQRTLLTPVIIDSQRTLLINRYIEVENLKKEDDIYKKVSFKAGDTALTLTQSRAIKMLCKQITKEMEFTEGSIMEVDFTSKGEQFSQIFLKTLIDNVESFYTATKTKKARENLAVLQKQLDSVKQQLYGAMGNVASFQDFNQNLVRQGPKVQQQKNSMKVSINSAMYQQLVTGLETAKVTLQQETPLFEIIDEPVLPLDKIQPGKIKWGLAGLLLGIFLSAGWLLMKRIFQEIMTGE